MKILIVGLVLLATVSSFASPAIDCLNKISEFTGNALGQKTSYEGKNKEGSCELRFQYFESTSGITGKQLREFFIALNMIPEVPLLEQVYRTVWTTISTGDSLSDQTINSCRVVDNTLELSFVKKMHTGWKKKIFYEVKMKKDDSGFEIYSGKREKDNEYFGICRID